MFFVLRVLSGPRVKFVQWRALKAPVVYAGDHSRPVVPVLFLFCVALWFAVRGASCLVLPCFLSVCFVCPFGILVALLAEEGAGLCAYRAFVC